MKTKFFYLVTALLLCVSLNLAAQKTPADGKTESPEKKQHALNFIKLNLTALAFKNYSVQYERITSRKTSVGASFRVMPNSSIPFKSQILNSLDDTDTTTRNAINKFKMSNFAFTPEFRFYVGKKGYGRGFYIALFYRYASFKSEDLIIEYENSASVKNNIALGGKLTSNTGGIMFGAQWLLGKHLCLDWMIIGPHYGSGTGTFTGVPSKPLTPSEQSDLRQELEDLDIPLTDKTVNVTANSASLKLSGPWAGIRAGLSLGFRF